MLSTKAERYVVLEVILKYLFEACFSNRDDLSTDLNNLSTNVLSKHCISNEFYLVVYSQNRKLF
jgi:hypothetical protein